METYVRARDGEGFQENSVFHTQQGCSTHEPTACGSVNKAQTKPAPSLRSGSGQGSTSNQEATCH